MSLAVSCVICQRHSVREASANRDFRATSSLRCSLSCSSGCPSSNPFLVSHRLHAGDRTGNVHLTRPGLSSPSSPGQHSCPSVPGRESSYENSFPPSARESPSHDNQFPCRMLCPHSPAPDWWRHATQKNVISPVRKGPKQSVWTGTEQGPCPQTGGDRRRLAPRPSPTHRLRLARPGTRGLRRVTALNVKQMKSCL